MSSTQDNDVRLKAGQRLGGYVVLGEVGRGASAVIYQVRHQDSGQEFAAKVLRPSVAKQDYVKHKFLSELEILRELQHPNVITLVDSYRDDNHIACIMELVRGSTLEEYLPLHPGGLSEVLTMSVALQVVDAMTYAHSHGIVHRDLKPSNILLQQEDSGSLRAYVGDFGLAKALGKESKTRTGLRVGTIAYMAPEQIQDSSRVDARADVYALGVTLYECLTGNLPFPLPSMYEVMQAQLTKDMPSVCHRRVDVSPGWDNIIQAASKKDREERITSIELLNRLQGLARQLGLVDRTTVAISPVSPEQMETGLLADRPPIDPQRKVRVTLPLKAGGHFGSASPDADSMDSLALDTDARAEADELEPDPDATVRSLGVEPVRAQAGSVDLNAVDSGEKQQKVVPAAVLDDEARKGFENTLDFDVKEVSRAMGTAPGDARGRVTRQTHQVPSFFERPTPDTTQTSSGEVSSVARAATLDESPSPPPSHTGERATGERADSGNAGGFAAPTHPQPDRDSRRAKALQMVDESGPSKLQITIVLVIIALGLAGVLVGLYFAAR